MTYGGGKYVPGIYDKVLPGVYTSVRSEKQHINLIGAGGTVAMPLYMKWGIRQSEKKQEPFIRINYIDFMENCFDLFLCAPTDDDVRPLLETFLGGAKEILLVNVNAGADTAHATSIYATAKYPGSYGNRISTSMFLDGSVRVLDVLIDGKAVESFSVSGNELSKVPSKFVVFEDNLPEHASTPLSGGTDAALNNGIIYDFTANMDSAEFDTVAFAPRIFELEITEATYILWAKILAEWATSMDEEYGKKFRVVVEASYNAEPMFENTLNNYRVIQVSSPLLYPSTSELPVHGSLVYYTAGLDASTLPGKSLTNTTYNGTYGQFLKEYPQDTIKDMLSMGIMLYHSEYDRVCVYSDINSLTTYTDDVSSIFSKPNTIRTLDMFDKNVSRIFKTNFLGKVPMDQDGLDSLKGQILDLGRLFVDLRAFKKFDTDSVYLEAIGTDSVHAKYTFELSGVMEKLYLDAIIK